jgi:hypothetical protein
MNRIESRRVSSRVGEVRRALAVAIGLCALFLNALAGVARKRSANPVGLKIPGHEVFEL